MGVEAAHLGDAAGIIGDGAVGVDGDGDAGGGEHADGGEGDTVEVAGDGIGYVNADADEDDGHPCAHHADGDAADDGGGGAGLRLARDALDGCIVLGGIDLGDKADDEADDEPRDDRGGAVEAAEEDIAEDNGTDRDDDGGDVGAHFQSLMGVGVITAADEEGGDDGGEDADGRDGQGEDDAGAGEETDGGDTESYRGDDSADVAFKEVSAHAGDVADVIADVIGDDGGVARVVLGDAGLDLAAEAGTDVGCLGIDAAADAREERDGGSAEGEAEENVIAAGEDVDKAASEKAETDDAHAHDRAAGESDGEGAVHAVLKGGVRGADIGLGGDAHAEEASEDRAAGARNKAQRCGKINENGDQDKQDKNKNSQNLIF